MTITSHPLESIDEFRKLMFNDAITTVGDKERWIYECIATSSDLTNINEKQNGNGNGNHNNAPQIPKSNLEMLTGHSHIDLNQQLNNAEQNIDSKPAAVTDPDCSMHKLWGLTQKHGGPCGVLAAIQAEMIRILLFGRECASFSSSNVNRSSNDNKSDGKLSNAGKECKLFYPFYAAQDKQGTNHSITQDQVRESLAMTMGMILARASMMPCASVTTSDKVISDNYSVSLVFPEEENESIGGDADTIGIRSGGGGGWITNMLSSNPDPANSHGGSETKPPLGLRVVTITCPKISEIASSTSQLLIEEEEEDDASPEFKRRKKKEVTFASSDGPQLNSGNNNSDKLSPEERSRQQQMSLLARGVADYLLGRTFTVANNNIGTDNNNSTTTMPLDYYSGPGGIIYFVMGLVKSRGVDTIKHGE